MKCGLAHSHSASLWPAARDARDAELFTLIFGIVRKVTHTLYIAVAGQTEQHMNPLAVIE